MRITRLLPALFLGSALVLAGCGDGDSDSTSDDINVTGDFGEKPTLEIPEGDPSGDLETQVVSEGDGPEVGTDDFVVAHYLGQTWEDRDGEDYVFDNSYDRQAASGFSLNGVIQGWKEGLAGQKVGSRVLLTIPPESGYGESPDHDLAEDTLVFVVDIVDSVAPDAAASGEPVSDLPEGMPAVEGSEAGAPSVDFSDASAPEESDSTVLIRGDGPELGENIVAQLLEAPYPDGEGAQSTWDLGAPEQIPVAGLASLPGWDDVSDGLTVGSRVLTRINAEDATPEGAEDEGPALVLIVDILSTY